jgi:hypothetical protein
MKLLTIKKHKSMKNSIQILKNNAELDTTTVYHENGDIQVYACPWNEGAEPLTDGNKKTYRARITMAENGDFTVKAYRIGSQGPRYRKRFATEHCEVLESDNGQLLERWKFAPTLSIHEVWSIRRREQPAVNAYYLTLKENLL